jgi:pyruvate/2-oxoglutarate dehydrogenase complex dihydrolipoamide dehydrogenase (E3) component
MLVTTFVVVAAIARGTPLTRDLLIIGGGSAGLTAAKFAATFGKSVTIIEKARLGGDCTWTGCVPSKTLLAIAKRAHAARTAGNCDFLSVSPTAKVVVDMKAVKAKVASVVEKIYTEDDSVEALQKLGIETVEGAASFIDSSNVLVERPEGTMQMCAKQGIIIATGAGPVTPKLDGLHSVPYITYEDVFSLDTLPARLTVVGGGPIGCELSQAFSRLGTTVTLVAPCLLPGEEAEAVGVARSELLDLWMGALSGSQAWDPVGRPSEW